MRELRLCEMYGCLPSQLAQEETYKLARHRAIKGAEAEYSARDDEAKSYRKGKR